MSNKLEICQELKDLPKIKVSEINDLQGNFKDLFENDYNKLSGLLDKYGFKYPLYLWFDKDGKAWNLDGNQRVRVINKIYGNIELPYIKVFAENKKEAKKQILAISSEFGKVNKDGFDEFTFDLEKEFIDDFTTFDKWNDVEISEEEKSETDLSDEIINQLRIEIICENEQIQQNLYSEFLQRGFECKILTL